MSQVEELQTAVDEGFRVLENCKRAAKGEAPVTKAAHDYGLGDVFNDMFSNRKFNS